MINLRIIVLMMSSVILFCGCSAIPKLDQVLVDKRTSYQRSTDLPVLEVPPDLTVTEGNNKSTIPGEAEATTLTEFERNRNERVKRGNIVLGSGEAENEQWLALQGTVSGIWPRLRQFWLDRGYQIELDDVELGVLETGWQQNESYRDQYNIVVEPNEQGDVIIFLSTNRQELSDGQWFNSVPDTLLEKRTIRELNLHFYGTAISSADTGTTALENTYQTRAEIIDVGQGKAYLAIPQEFTRAWRDTETVLLRAGYTIVNQNQEKGIYDFLYIKPGASGKGFFSKLKFWDSSGDGTPYQLSLTGVGNKTEIIIVNQANEWETSEVATDILKTLRTLYEQI